ncbi:response regulator [Azoarcus sp. TTM-91]|uniref:response regulator n=1 Tax=Azoarcus sp. TTM-91 TaxID=2691581 RepID=UPI00145DBC29|nr:response regulator [Azoarcus sp. TTM-91]NMG36900.1 response regulator [Azoarcus sp. TTM-91]
MSDSVRILVVDDHEDIREPLAAYLSRYNLEVTVAADGAGMRNALARSRFDLIVLDVMLPGEDGLSLCRWVHEHLRTPVILLTAMADTADRVAGLEMGADDYMVKPFEPRELVARIRGVLRRLRMAQPEAMQAPRDGVRRYGFGRWVLDVGRRELYGEGGRAVQLGAAEFRLLQALVEHPNTVLSRERLLDLIRGSDTPVFDRSIDSQVSRLRKKLEDDSRHPRLLRTAWGDGYLLSADVRRLQA